VLQSLYSLVTTQLMRGSSSTTWDVREEQDE
jgi:hypothetical protein